MKQYLEESGLTTNDVDQIIGVTLSIFGTDWLEDLEKKRINTPPDLQHPVLIGSASGSFTHLIELLELCTYLVAFKDDTKLNVLIPPLKILSSYNDAFFQLAMAYRFKKLGFQVILEPAILNGQLADFQLALGDMKIMVECTVLREWGIRAAERESFWQGCVQQLKKLHNKSDIGLVVEVVSEKALSAENLSYIRDAISKGGSAFSKTNQRSVISNEWCEVTVYEMTEEINNAISNDGKAFFKSQPEWVTQLTFSWAEPKVPGDITTVDIHEDRPRSLIRYKSKLPAEEDHEYSLENMIDKKSLSKIKQLKSHPSDHSSILFIEVEDKLEGADIERIGKRLANNVFPKVPTLNGVFLARREWVGQKHQYIGTMFGSSNPLNPHLFEGFNMLERDIDFVKCWREEMGSQS